MVAKRKKPEPPVECPFCEESFFESDNHNSPIDCFRKMRKTIANLEYTVRDLESSISKIEMWKRSDW